MANTIELLDSEPNVPKEEGEISMNAENNMSINSYPLQDSQFTDGYDSGTDPEFTPGIIGLKDDEVRSQISEENSRNSSESGKNTQNSKNTKASKTKRKPAFVFFCESEVLNFARHVTRNHSMEVEVQRILSKSKKSCFKPRKQSQLGNKSLLCIHCLGFYSSKYKRNHKRICPEYPQKLKYSVRDSQASLSMHMRIDELLKQKVFHWMQADRVSLIAQSHNLICAFGAEILKLHKENYKINLVSRRMREIAKILIEIKNNKPSIRNLLQAL
ncbi:hypothetical protein WA026_004272 [Henosepilachna vigintioctopunctata]|uniref:Uncharacterized protein n=1 Tax=Henosepilachna vigintioctopunctata TaxID=420089 RepID=A0AAW1V6G4_9CUCU